MRTLFCLCSKVQSYVAYKKIDVTEDNCISQVKQITEGKSQMCYLNYDSQILCKYINHTCIRTYVMSPK